MYNLTVAYARGIAGQASEARASRSSRGSRSASGPLAAPDGPLQRIAADHHATPVAAGAGVAAEALARSMLPIPGTSSVAHLEENVAAASITLSDEEFETLSKAGAAS